MTRRRSATGPAGRQGVLSFRATKGKGRAMKQHPGTNGLPVQATGRGRQ